MKCSTYCIPCETMSNASYVIPGFNTHVKELHTEARNSYIIWRAAGKPRDHLTRDNMNITRLRFKRALKHCKLIPFSSMILFPFGSTFVIVKLSHRLYPLR